MAVEPGRSAAEAAFFEFLSGAAGTGPEAFERFCAERPALSDELRPLWASWCEMEPMLKSLLSDREGDLSLSRLLAGGPSVDASLPSVSLRLLDGKRRPAGGIAPAQLVEQLAERLGFGQRYRLEGIVGRGGMGAVRLAWDHNLRRHLAMKVVEASPASTADQALLARFLEEALVTGQLDHPGIVPVHELGVDDQGCVYFTMKLVKGKSLARILELVAAGEEGWTLNRAVGVLRRVCEAVAYAHSKGVIHRDIKPGNVLVGRYGETYLMDWGLARVLRAAGAAGVEAADGAEGVEGAAAGAAAGGAAGAEGAAANADGVDLPRVEPPAGDLAPTDSWLFTQDGNVVGTPVYMSPEQALGDIERVDGRSDIYSLGAILYHLLTGRMPYVEPGERPLPIQVIALVRRGPPVPVASLAPQAPPTLLAICERAMAREIGERFASADAMTAALEDYLEDSSEAREEARRQARRAQLVNAFLIDMLASGDPSRAQGRQVTVREVLDRAARSVETAFPEQPLDEAALRETIGNLYRELGLPAAAEPHLLKSAALVRDVLGAEHPDTLRSNTSLGLLLRRLGRLNEAEELLRSTLAAQERVVGGEHPDALRTLNTLASVVRRARARLDEAEALYRSALDGRRRALGEEHPDTLATASSLALVLKDTGRVEEAIPLLEAAAEGLLRHNGEHHPRTLIAMNDLAGLLQTAGRLGDAETLYRRTLEAQVTVLGKSHPDVFASMNNLSSVLRRLGRLDESLPLATEAFEGQRTTLGDDHPNTLSYAHNLALVLLEQGACDCAEPVLRDVVARAEATMPSEHRHAARYRHSLGRCLAACGRVDEARVELQRALTDLTAVLPGDHPWVREAEAALAAL